MLFISLHLVLNSELAQQSWLCNFFMPLPETTFQSIIYFGMGIIIWFSEAACCHRRSLTVGGRKLKDRQHFLFSSILRMIAKYNPIHLRNCLPPFWEIVNSLELLPNCECFCKLLYPQFFVICLYKTLI